MMRLLDRAGPRTGALAHRLLLDRTDETRLSAEELEVRSRMFVARNFGYAWLTAALLQLAMLAVPAEGRREVVLAVIAALGLATSALHFVLYERVPPWAYQASLTAGWAAAGVDLWAAGEQGIVSILFFAWIGVYAAAVYGLRTLLWQLPAATTAATVGLATGSTGVSAWFGPLAIATVVAMSVLVYAGNLRTRRLFETVVAEREERELSLRYRQALTELGALSLAATSYEQLLEDAVARMQEDGVRCRLVDGSDPGPGSTWFEIPGDARVLVLEASPAGREPARLVASAGRLLGIAGRRFAEEERRLRLETELADARRLEAIGRLAGGVAHDFNNVLTVILGNTELALADVPPGSEVARRLQETQVAGSRATSLVTQLLALGSRQLVVAGPVDLAEVLDELDDILRRLLGEACRLRVAVAPGTPPCRADRTQVEQVILNLVANARDAMPTGGEVSVVVGLAADPPRAPLSGRYVELTVHDTGVGMDEETRRRAFEPFFTSKPFGSGTGLGLATVHGILHQAGGAARIESEPGRGTTFHVYLPAATSPDEPDVTSPPCVR